RINKYHLAEKTSYIDSLTNLPNRRSFESKISKEWKQAIRERKGISILLMDLDNFKNVNDSYGHQQGDVVLKYVSEIFMQVLKRGSDYVSRWGGEEFVALLFNSTLDDTIKIAELIRYEVEKANIPYGDDKFIKITISIGINFENPEKTSSVEDFIKKADIALYAAKKNGRNRLCWG
ncbi:MAG: GGDEF domain-containing protein, partial [Treponema sp.]|nr:GGDEF domain-containing protein [Treponema sp.]